MQTLPSMFDTLFYRACNKQMLLLHDVASGVQNNQIVKLSILWTKTHECTLALFFATAACLVGERRRKRSWRVSVSASSHTARPGEAVCRGVRTPPWLDGSPTVHPSGGSGLPCPPTFPQLLQDPIPKPSVTSSSHPMPTCVQFVPALQSHQSFISVVPRPLLLFFKLGRKLFSH